MASGIQGGNDKKQALKAAVRKALILDKMFAPQLPGTCTVAN